MNTSKGKRKTKHTLLLFLLALLFIPILQPKQVYADSKSSVSQILNLNAFDTNDTEETTGDQAGYLYWAASGDRCGLLITVVDDKGVIRAQKTYLENSSGYSGYEAGCNTATLTSKLQAVNRDNVDGGIGYLAGTSTVTYSNGWQAQGCAAMDTIMADSEYEIEVDGARKTLPIWAAAVATGGGGVNALLHFFEDEVTWTVWAEPVSCQYIYSNKKFQSSYTDGNNNKIKYEEGDPKPYGSITSTGVYTPTKYCGTAKGLAIRQIELGNPFTGSDYTWKFLNKALPWSLCLDHDQGFAAFGGGYDAVGTIMVNAPILDGHLLTSSEINDSQKGVAIAAIEVESLKEPIHTFGGITPGNTEEVNDFNSGTCFIQKVYYTETYDSDGNSKGITNIRYYKREKTTNNIIIDSEDNYEIVGWKTNSSIYPSFYPTNFDDLGYIRKGKSSGEIKLDKDNGETVLLVVYKSEIVLNLNGFIFFA